MDNNSIESLDAATQSLDATTQTTTKAIHWEDYREVYCVIKDLVMIKGLESSFVYNRLSDGEPLALIYWDHDWRNWMIKWII